jgi:hypothetical protein
MWFLRRRNCMDCHVWLSLVLLARSTAYIRNVSTCAHSWYSGTSFIHLSVALCHLAAVAWQILLHQFAGNSSLTRSSHRLEPCPARSATRYGPSYTPVPLLVACYRLLVVLGCQRTHLIKLSSCLIPMLSLSPQPLLTSLTCTTALPLASELFQDQRAFETDSVVAHPPPS